MTVLQQLAEQDRLLALEYEYEREEYEALCRKVGIRRRIRQGKCWFPVYAGRTYYNALDQYVIEVTAPDELDITDHEFEPGRPVAFFYVGDDAGTPDAPVPDAGDATAAGDSSVTRFLPFQCQVSRLDERRMTVTVPGTQAALRLRALAHEGRLGVQLGFDATSYHVMREAIRRWQDIAVAKDDGNIGKQKRLLHTLIGETAPTFGAAQPVRFPWLNRSQEQAVQRVLCAREVAVVHGPPGTGKTTTLVEAIGETLQREAQVMVCAQSNAAVDWIAEQLLARGLSVLRIGNPTRVSDTLLGATYERRYADHPAYLELWGARKALREARSQVGGRHVSATRRAELGRHMSKLKQRIAELEIRINQDLFDGSRVVACTLIASAARVLERRHFPTLFIDEAAQALEAACWAAILKADRVILAGDHCQLPPTVKCREAELAGLGKTLMQKVVQRKPECVSLLTVQYRMHRDIMQFSSQWFYHGQLTAAPECATRTVLPVDSPLVWVDTSRLGFEEEQHPMSQSRLNTAEAGLLCNVLETYVQLIGLERLVEQRVDFGIISPYKSQVLLLRSLVRQRAALRPLLDAITVHTVDGFQGQERDVILISMVRGNDAGRIGFLGDLRRMNVALTRARMKLIVLGDASTLEHTAFYRKLIEHITEHGTLITPAADAAETAATDSMP